MHTNNIAVPVYNHTSVEYGSINAHVLGGSVCGLMYRIATPVCMRCRISCNYGNWEFAEHTECFEWYRKIDNFFSRFTDDNVTDGKLSTAMNKLTDNASPSIPGIIITNFETFIFNNNWISKVSPFWYAVE